MWLYIILGPVLPVATLLGLQLWVRSFWDANNAIFGVLYSLSSSILFQVFIKWLIGGLRPHFLDVCKPDILRANKSAGTPYNAAGFQSIYYTREICTGDPRKIDDSLTSFPSGHTTAAFAGFVFVYLYMNGKFKVFANQHTPMWKLLLIHAPILVAVIIGGALTIDEFHNWYDIVVGGIIGTATAVSSYRMTYASIFDWRWNHIPLSRTTPFSYDLPSSDSGPSRVLADSKRVQVCEE